MSSNRNSPYKTITLFVSPERFKADLAYIRNRYKHGSDHPLVQRVVEEDRRQGDDNTIRAKK